MNARLTFVAVFVAALGLALAGCQKQQPGAGPAKAGPQDAQPTLAKVTITVGEAALEVEVASAEAQRERGYMFRPEPKDGGMLFVFPTEDLRVFYMKNTTFDLDAVHIAADGRVAQIVRMKAFNEEPVAGLRPAQYVLEVPAGWCDAHHAQIGTMVKIPADLAAKAEPEGPPPAGKRKR